MFNKFTYKYGITHGGATFHSDDVFATAFCKYFAMKENINFSFDRKFNVTDEEFFSKSIIVYDIGYDFLPEYGIFDHHQTDVPLRQDGQKFSACGLILREFGPTYFSESELIVLENNIVKFIDYHDNGSLLPGEVSSEEIYDLSVFSPIWDENPLLQNRYFSEAVNLAINIICYEISLANGIKNVGIKEEILKKIENRKKCHELGEIRAKEIAVSSLDTLENGIITLPKFVPVKNFFADKEFLSIHGNPDIYFIIHPGDRNPFNVHVIPKKPDVFQLKIPGGFTIILEKDSCGDFILPVGVEFVHVNGFLAACNTYDAAKKLCINTLQKFLSI